MLIRDSSVKPPVFCLHVTHAQVFTQQILGIARPPYTLGAGEPDGQWTDSVLPRAPRAAHFQYETRRIRNVGGMPMQITWYKVPDLNLEAVTGPRYLYVPRWKSDGLIDIYSDGRLIYQSHTHSQWNGSERPLLIALDEFSNIKGTAVAHAIIIRMQHVGDVGGALSSLWIGNEEALGWRFRLREWLEVELPDMTNSAWVALGVFSLFVWLKRTRDPLYLYFFLISVEAYLHSTHSFAGSQRLPVADEWFDWLTINAGFWLMAISHLFINHLNQLVQPRLTHAVIGITVMSGMLTLPLPALADLPFAAPLAYLAILLTANIVFGMGLWHFWKSRLRLGMLLSVWGLVSVASGVYDWMMRSNMIGIEGLFLNPYANVGSFFIFTYIMFTRYVDALKDVELTNKSLEGRLREREIELIQSHTRLRAVEQRTLLDQERQRMTQDMHDGLGSTLVSALRVVERGRLDADQIADLLRTCIDDLKLAIDSMEVVDADLLLLLATLRFRLAPRLESAGLKLHWEIHDVPDINWLTPRDSLHILRILQEAFTNIIKHAQATEIIVSTAVENASVLVSIRDNGPGFDLAHALCSGGKGLSNQIRRAESVGGTLRWQSGEAGTQLNLLLPVTREALVDAH